MTKLYGLPLVNIHLFVLFTVHYKVLKNRDFALLIYTFSWPIATTQ